jgi:hypothetical protein
LKVTGKILFLLLIFCNSFADNKILEVGEELTYKVYYGFIKLGEVRFKISSYDAATKKYTSTAELKNYEALPLIKINYFFESTMQSKSDSLFSTRFYSSEFKEKDINHIDYTFDYEKGIVIAKVDNNFQNEERKEIKIDASKRFQDGLSLFFNARIQSLSNKNYIVPVYINGQESTVNYSFNMNKDVVSSDLKSYDMSAIKILGTAHFKGVFGLTGEFIGWLSDDDARVPLKAKFNVSIGSVTLELTSYKKKNWSPPVYDK